MERGRREKLKREETKKGKRGGGQRTCGKVDLGYPTVPACSHLSGCFRSHAANTSPVRLDLGRSWVIKLQVAASYTEKKRKNIRESIITGGKLRGSKGRGEEKNDGGQMIGRKRRT